MALPARQPQGLTPEIQTLGDYLSYLPAYQVLVCKDHGAVRSWTRHLKEFHQVKKKEQQALDERYQISTLPLTNPRDITLPPPNQPPIPLLGAPIPAYSCTRAGCVFITKNRNEIQRHYNKAHNWRTSPQDQEPWACIQAQTFFRTGGFQKYFEVQPVAEGESSTPSGEISLILQEIQSSQAKHAESLAIGDATVAKTNYTGWFKRNRWPIHLANCNLAHLHQASRMPNKDETLLTQAATIVEQAIKQAVSGLSTLGLKSRR